MSDTQNPQKALEVKIRTLPGQERQDQKDLSRVFLSSDAMRDLRIEAGQPCYIWKTDVPGWQRREAIAWPSSQKLNKNVAQMFKTFQEACGFRLEDRIAISPAEDLQTVSCVVLRDTSSHASLNERDRPHWEWYMEDKLERAEIVFHRMSFEISFRGPKRSFVLESFMADGTASPHSIARFAEGSTVKIGRETSPSPSNGQDEFYARLQIPDIAGIEEAVQDLNLSLMAFEGGGLDTVGPSWVRRSCGLLLHGAHGTGKTLVLKKICETNWGRVFHVYAHMKVSALRDMFKDAKQSRHGIIIIDDIDRLVSKDGNSSYDFEMALGEEMDRLSLIGLSDGKIAPQAVVLAATSSISEIPRSLKKPGRFTTDILLPLPDTDARKRILRSLAPFESSETQLDLIDGLGDRTHAYTAQDLVLLMEHACEMARRRRSVTTASALRTEDPLLQPDIEQALLAVRPTAMHDITLKPPTVRWYEIGGQGNVKKALRRAVEIPLRYPNLIRELGATPKKGLLLYGPPGCSKTLSAQAMATEIGFNFFAVKGAELLNMYVGESERAVREIFSRARAAAPSIIFFDEIESIGSKREPGGKASGVNVLTTLLNEMDGIETLKGVTVLAATNKPEALDLALLRPGRFDDLLYVAPPDQAGREEIFNIRKKKMRCADDVDVSRLAELTDGYSGAEIAGICQAACDRVIDMAIDTGDMTLRIHMEDFLKAMENVKRQITPDLIDGYQKWAAGLRSGSS